MFTSFNIIIMCSDIHKLWAKWVDVFIDLTFNYVGR